MIQKHTRFFLIYLFLALFDLVLGGSEYASFRPLTKPLILLSLIFYFAIRAKGVPKATFVLMLCALVFSFLGDVFLLFDAVSDLYFILGLLSFLTAHILYCFVFLKKWKRRNRADFWWVTLLLIIYGAVLFYIVKDYLGELTLPVTIYILGILSMAITAYGRKGSVDIASFNLVFLGALCFVISDSILAINKFMVAITWSHILIMGTYAAAQYLIVIGILRQNTLAQGLDDDRTIKRL